MGLYRWCWVLQKFRVFTELEVVVKVRKRAAKMSEKIIIVLVLVGSMEMISSLYQSKQLPRFPSCSVKIMMMI